MIRVFGWLLLLGRGHACALRPVVRFSRSPDWQVREDGKAVCRVKGVQVTGHHEPDGLRNAKCRHSPGVLRERGRRGLPCDKLYRQMFNFDLYLLAYGKIYANHGAMTPGASARPRTACPRTRSKRSSRRCAASGIASVRSGGRSSRKRTGRCARWGCRLIVHNATPAAMCGFSRFGWVLMPLGTCCQAALTFPVLVSGVAGAWWFARRG